MNFQLSALPENFLGVSYGAASIAAATAVVILVNLSQDHNLDVIPTVGSSTWLGSWRAGFKFRFNAVDVLQEGYEKHKSTAFKVAELYHWLVIVSNREQIEELRRAPDDVFSFQDATNERLNMNYTLGSGGADSDAPFHVSVVRSQLTRNIGTLYPQIRDEIVTAFDEVLDLKGNEWKSVPALDAIRQVVGRTSNRLFIGLPLCRHPDWINLNIQYTIDVFKAGNAIGLFPKFMRPLAAYFLTGATHRGRIHGLKHIGPMIEERLRHLNEHGNEWDGKPNDLLSWLIEEAEGPGLTVKSLASNVMIVNFAAIHTSSNNFTNALFYLAENHQYIQPLREEVETVVEKEGWSKDSLGKMHKVDSFLRESQRIGGSGVVSITRKALKDFTFTDGTFIPKGTLIGVASRGLHHDEQFYESANVFKPFRFAGIREMDGEGLKYQFVSTGLEYLPFGHGRHACPGRFFAANELKSMLAHIVVTYDIRLDDDAICPRQLRYGTGIRANPTARVQFRKRVD